MNQQPQNDQFQRNALVGAGLVFGILSIPSLIVGLPIGFLIASAERDKISANPSPRTIGPIDFENLGILDSKRIEVNLPAVKIDPALKRL